MDDETPPPFGIRLRDLRQKAGLSPAQLAARIGVGENAIRKLEKGQSNEPSFTNGVRIARALGVSPDALAGEPDLALPVTALLSEGTYQRFSPLVAFDRDDPLLKSRMGAALHAQVGEMRDRLEVVERQAAEVVTALRETDTVRRAMLALLDAIEMQPGDRQSVATILESEQEG